MGNEYIIFVLGIYCFQMGIDTSHWNWNFAIGNLIFPRESETFLGKLTISNGNRILMEFSIFHFRLTV